MVMVIISVCSLKSICIASFVLIGCCGIELWAHLYPFRNVWPDVVYCFTALYLPLSCLSLFYQNYVVYYNAYCECSLKAYVYQVSS